MKGKDISSKLTAQLVKEASERKHAEGLINLFVKNAPGAVAVVDSSLAYRSISDKWYEHFNLDHHDLIGESLLDLSQTFCDTEWTRSFERVLEGEHLRGEDQLIETSNGNQFWVNWELLPWADKNGAVAGLVISFEILNDKKQLTNRLAETTQVLEMAVSASGLGFWHWKEDDDQLTWDEGMMKLFDVKPGEFTGKGGFFLTKLHEADTLAMEEILVRTLKVKGEYHTQYRILTNDGIKIIKEHGKVFENNGLLRMTGICEDITEEERLKKELELLNQGLESQILERTDQLGMAYEETRSLTYSLSHDLRAPLRAITAYVEAIKEDIEVPLTGETLDYFDRIDTNSKKAIRLIDDLLAYSRVIHQKLQFESIDTEEFIRGILLDFNPEQVQRIRLEPMPSIFGDKTTLKQALYNVIDNALKFSEGEVKIYGEHSNDSSYIHIQDYGIGFSMEDSLKIFEVFRKLNPDDQYGGSGIGLSLAKRILQINNGRINAQSKKGEGARFTLKIPLRG